MEFEIINEILTSTVANLFPNRAVHMSYFRSDEELNRIDIPRSSNRKETHGSDTLTEQWKQNEGKKRLEDAFAKLKIDELKIKNKDYLKDLPTEFLANEKNKVKSELKQYDNEFTSVFRRPPSRNDKEIMRPLYMYYKNLKTQLDLRKNDPKYNTNTTNTIQSNSSTNHQTKTTVNEVKKTLNTSNASHNNSGASVISTNSFVSNNNYLKEEKKTMDKIETKNLTLEKNHLNAKSMSAHINSKESKDQKDSNKELDDNFLGGNIQKSNFQSNLNLNTMKERDIRKLAEELEQEYSVIKKEQTELKTKLHDYHNEFYQNHKRKVKYYKDIVPVETEYKKYKENKARILEITDILTKIKKLKK